MKEKNNSGFGLVQVFWGNGKGKTTAALGTALRAIALGKRVLLVQFLKAGVEKQPGLNSSGEVELLQKFPNFFVKRFGTGDWFFSRHKDNLEGHKREALLALKEACANISSGEFDLVVLDEVLYAVSFGLLSEKQLLEELAKKAPGTEVILTGSHKKLAKIEAAADLVTEIRKVKHPFDRGVLARKGLDY
ncbi:MAG: cob(I)yrinic acid a,c-diamide adenosyltransferase [Candidatus Diapherotrites archaeon]|nr:cob(I)yrinic acid a,c-diamide adenosyltransferase [Candidatus Diapherotrites archaeon]